MFDVSAFQALAVIEHPVPGGSHHRQFLYRHFVPETVQPPVWVRALWLGDGHRFPEERWLHPFATCLSLLRFNRLVPPEERWLAPVANLPHVMNLRSARVSRPRRQIDRRSHDSLG